MKTEKSSATIKTLSAFLFSSSIQIQNNKQTLHFFGRTNDPEFSENSLVEIRITNNFPTFFVPQNTDIANLPILNSRNVFLKSHQGIPLKALYFANRHTLLNTSKALKKRGIAVFESDIAPDERFLMERYIFGGIRVRGVANMERGRTVFINPELKPQKIEANFSILSLDIETGVRDGLLYSIGLHFTNAQTEKKIIILNGSFDSQIENLELHVCQNEQEVLRTFLAIFKQLDPDIIIGWNVIAFDFQFLLNKSNQLKIPLTLGRNFSTAKIRQIKNRSLVLDIMGRVILDGPIVLRSAFYKFSNFKLETVSRELLNTGKDIKKTGDGAQEIERMYFHDRGEFLKYNIKDCILVTEIFKKTGMIELQKKRTEISGMFLDKTHRSVAAFEFCFLPDFHRKGFAAIDTADIHFEHPATGGYVMEPKVGLHENVLVLDFKSLYPSIIQTFFIDPLSRMQNKVHAITTPSGHSFSSTEHILPGFISNLLKERQIAKQKNDSHLSMAIKILMNSFYGVMGSAGCRFYHPDLPTAITKTGQWLLKESKVWLENTGYSVLYGDTDSLFITKTNWAPHIAKKEGSEIAAEITTWWKKRIKQEYDVDSCLEMEFEKHFIQFFLPPSRTGGGAKKRYAGLLDVNGKNTIHFVGMESVRTDWSILAREFQRELFEKFFGKQEIQNWITDLIKKLKNHELDQKLTITKRLRKPVDEYVTNVPQHVKAARLLKKPVRSVSYKITKDGPVPIELHPKNFDYVYYIDHQIRPIAESVLWALDLDFSDMIGSKQLHLFR